MQKSEGHEHRLSRSRNNCQSSGEIKPTGMNAGGFKMLRVRDDRGREYTMNSHNLQLDGK